MMLPIEKLEVSKIFLMEKDVLKAEEEFFRFEQIAEPIYLWNLIALIIAAVFCTFLFRII